MFKASFFLYTSATAVSRQAVETPYKKIVFLILAIYTSTALGASNLEDIMSNHSPEYLSPKYWADKIDNNQGLGKQFDGFMLANSEAYPAIGRAISSKKNKIRFLIIDYKTNPSLNDDLIQHTIVKATGGASLNRVLVNQVSPESMKAVAKLVENTPSLSKLSIEHTFITKDMAKQLATAIKKNSSLSELNLHKSITFDLGARDILKEANKHRKQVNITFKL